MSSFDVLAPDAVTEDEATAFVPLSPTSSTSPTGPLAAWRPLFGDQPGESMRRPGSGEEVPPRQDGTDAFQAQPEPAREEDTRAFAAGYELGRQETRADVEVVAEALVTSVEKLDAMRARLRHRYEQELLQLALGVAKKVVRAEVQERPEVWLEMIRAAVRGAVDRDRIRVRVPAPVAAYLTEQFADLRSRLDDVKELTVVEDPTLLEGGCVIETQFGELDIGIGTQLEQIERGLRRTR
jgi:flagellar assembly protein FliH